MPLEEITFKHEYRSDKTNLIKDFYTPCLKNAVRYCRAVAYFTSNSLQKNVDGLSTFIQNEGKINLVTGHKLMEDDIESIKKGYEIKEKKSDPILDYDFLDVSDDRLKLLTWLIVQNHLDIKVAFPSDSKNKFPHAVYHEKTGVFIDKDKYAVAFSGSSNETVGGLLNNFESIDVHCSWTDEQGRVQQKIDNFERLWQNMTDKLEVVDFLTAFEGGNLIPQTVYETEDETINETQRVIENTNSYLPNGIELRDYQTEAIEAWFQNGCRGIWEMATGTGKTITALSALAKLREEKKRLFVIIVCPYQHLVDQWHKEARKFGFEPILAYKNSSTWVNRLNSALVRFNWGVYKIVYAITTQATFFSQKMQNLICKLKRDVVIIADEVHLLGTVRGLEKLTEHFNYRLGMSATPNRWFDEPGTIALKTYFGKTVYEFSLDKAIENGYLCPYYYYPHLVELTDSEFEQYEKLTVKISKLYHLVESNEISVTLKQLLIRRSMLLSRAENKLKKLKEILVNKIDLIHHTLFYCAPGRIVSVLNLLTDLGLRIAKFTAEESISKRQELLEMFASGNLQALVAIKCLDEGVDIPNTQTAYILASSNNPKEFIQRRGRILRKSFGKEYAEIHDLIVVPTINYQQYLTDTFRIERNIVTKELIRFNEFAGMATNKFEAREIIWDLAKEYNLLGSLGEN